MVQDAALKVATEAHCRVGALLITNPNIECHFSAFAR
jgi:hypothetical protein